jgi:beta-glucosidase-like glycosyl hydrolase
MNTVGKKFVSVILAGMITISACNTGTIVMAATNDESAFKFPDVYDSQYLKVESEAVINAKVDALIKTMTQEEKFGLLGGNGTGSNGEAGTLPGVPRLGVPEAKMYDGPAGVLSLYDTTNPPIEQMLAATWDPKMAYNYGKITGSENKAEGGNVQLGAQVDIMRMPQFGRAKDQMGEDPYLLSSLSPQLTKGMQDQNVMTVLKHYAAFAQDATPATSTNVAVSEQALHEIYLPGFETAVKSGNAAGVMSAYNMVNGTYSSANSYLQLDVLRKMWGYKGFTVTDWGGNNEFTLNKGTDIEMPNLTNNSQANAEKKISSGEITQDTIDSAAKHVLTGYGKAGYLGLVQVLEDGTARQEVGRTKHITLPADLEQLATERTENTALARKVAEEGAVLLKNNDRVLPLDQDKKVAVIGLGGMHLISGIGGERSYGTIGNMVSPYESLKEKLGDDKVEGQVGIDIVGVPVPAENLYKDSNSTDLGVTRTYGVSSSQGSSSDQQGQIKMSGSMADTKMGNYAIGTFACKDSNIDFNTGTIGGEPNKTYLSKNADAGTATAFTKGSAYTWTTYLQAPEDGDYSLILEGIGGSLAATIDLGNGTTKSLGISGVNQGAQWPADSIVPTETGMSISPATVTLAAGKRYKVTVQGIASLDQKDLQVRFAWITPKQKTDNYNNALTAAGNADTSVVFAYRQTTQQGNTIADTTCALDSTQEKLILDVVEKAKANGHKVVVVLNNSTPVTMERWIDKVDGLLEMYFPGQEGGIATAEILTGEVNPSGKLAFTIPKKDTDTLITYSQSAFDSQKIKEAGPEKPDSYYEASMKMFGTKTIEETKARMAAMGMDGSIHTSQYNEGIMTGYRWYDNMNIEPQYDFGYGLSYTKFKYSNLKVSENSQKGYDVTFNVTNTGSVTGSEVAQLYLGAAQVPNGVQMAKKQLAGYVRVEDLKPNETRTVSSTIENRSLCYWNTNSALVMREDGTQDKWTLATGERSLAVGSASNDETSLMKTINVKSTMALSGTTVPVSDNSGSDSSSHHHSGGSGNSSTATSTDIGTGASQTSSTIITSTGTFVTDTTTDVRVKGGYTMKLTSNNGKAPKVILGTPGVFDVQLVTTNGKDYFVKLIPIGKIGTQTGVYLDGIKLFAATIETPVSTSTVKSDTTRPFKVKKGASYVMKLTASSRPTLISGTPSAFRVELVKVSGSDYYFKIIPTGKTGVSCGLYVNSGKTPVTVATVA